jgi:pimeloyl-ACP methyl ester carboxylesterase
VPVSALYFWPSDADSIPVVIHSLHNWPSGKAEEVVQARGIGFALAGFGSIVLDPPGTTERSSERFGRRSFGEWGEPLCDMAMPTLGEAVWELTRAADAAQHHSGFAVQRLFVCGEGSGALAAYLAALLDDRFEAVVLAGFGVSLANYELAETLLPASGAFLGDWPSWATLRPNIPLLLMLTDDFRPQERDVQRRFNEYKNYAGNPDCRLEWFYGPFDFNRRMRESATAFFAEHSGLNPSGQQYLTERRPITDGVVFPSRHLTVPVSDDRIHLQIESTENNIELSGRFLEMPYPEPFVALERLVDWGKYGTVELPSPTETLLLADSNEALPGAVVFPFYDLPLNLLHSFKLSAPEFFAQLIHLSQFPIPEGFRDSGASGNPLASFFSHIGSKLSGASRPELKVVRAEGLLSSLTAVHLKMLRSSVAIEVSHTVADWRSLALTRSRPASLPMARYLECPYTNLKSAEPTSEEKPV